MGTGVTTTLSSSSMTHMQTIGTCSLCGGPVQLPTVWWSVTDPVPSCRHCGATPVPEYGPVIPMQHGYVTTTTSFTVPSKDRLQEMLKGFEREAEKLKPKGKKQKKRSR